MLDKETGKINNIHGGLRSDNGWKQLVLLPTREKAARWMAYRVSQFRVLVKDRLHGRGRNAGLAHGLYGPWASSIDARGAMVGAGPTVAHCV